jgi:lipopolysaccharide/colanic/teichoic acid biosynthesis glycosyltransferase
MYRHFFKRVFDIVICLIGLPFFFLIFIIVAPIIKFTDGGPVFYNAERLGKKGKTFKMYKFRSMKVNAPNLLNKDGSTYNGKNDPRVTKIGRFLRKTSLDETPQIFNVLFGHMSIIGPRAHILTRFKSYDELDDVRKHRLEVRPGIPGYSQAYFRNSASNDEKIQQDVYYVDNLTLWMDIKVFFKTIVSVLKRDNVYVKDEAPVKVVTVDENGNKVETDIASVSENNENKETVGAAD